MNNCCKYCLENSKENDQPLIYPCQCADGVHPNCLAIWLLVRPANNDKCRCEICHVNYIGVLIPRPTPPISPQSLPPPPPPSEEEEEDNTNINVNIVPPQRNTNVSLDFICCECQWFEACSYITGTILGLSSSIISVQPGYNYRSDIDLVFNVFVGLFIWLYSMGLICTGRRYYKKCIDERRVYDNDDD